MTILTRINIKRFVLCNGNKLFKGKNHVKVMRTITSLATRTEDDIVPKPEPWPYKEKSFTILNYFFDKTTARFDENSKILVVDGPIAAGKSKLAKELANQLGMLYLPEANLDMIYINHYGYDLKKLDSQLPESCRSFDVMDFLKTPKHRNVARFQIDQYTVRLSQYVDALAHVLSTGQGVILDRCVYSDFVFAEAMFSQGYLSKLARTKYYEFRDCTISELLKPHLVIYLDVPVPKVLENIKKRGYVSEVNSPALTPEYLKVMEKHYKQEYLKNIGKHAELLIYDWSDEGDVEVVVEDIERVDFSKYDNQDPHLKDWDHGLEEDWGVLRHKYADQKDRIMAYTNIPCYEVPELLAEPMEADAYHKVMAEAPGEQFQPGFNSTMGDTGLLFKVKAPHRNTLPLRERRME